MGKTRRLKEREREREKKEEEVKNRKKKKERKKNKEKKEERKKNQEKERRKKNRKREADALAGNRTRINCLEGNYADHYTTNASAEITWRIKLHIEVKPSLSRLQRCLDDHCSFEPRPSSAPDLRPSSFFSHLTQTQTQTQIHIFQQDCRKVTY